jgi:predicted ArsR family transcriptional regulator
MASDELDRRIDQVAALGEPVRRALYRFVSRQADAVSRDEAAAAVGVPRHSAKFHLDRLAADGLLTAEYRRPPGRGGPGAGRPAKVYRAVGDVDVSVPERHYDLAGRLLVRAIAATAETGEPLDAAVARVAREEGVQLAGGASSLPDVLTSCGFEPVGGDGDELTLRNCPFHRLAEENRPLVCGMNLAFVRGLLEGTGATGVAVLDPVPGGCCVRVTSAPG